LYKLVALIPASYNQVSLGVNYSVPLVDSKDNKAGHLIELVRIEAVTRQEARKAA
jgi:hypothetical protein